VLVPVYVPEIELGVTFGAVPVTAAPQLGLPDTDPAGIARLKLKVDPKTVPVRVPASVSEPSGLLAAAWPDTDEPDCVSIQVIEPGPLESIADPEKVPCSVTEAVGGLGVVGGGDVRDVFEPPQETRSNTERPI
jgi:hypothetical protein